MAERHECLGRTGEEAEEPPKATLPGLVATQGLWLLVTLRQEALREL